VYVRISMQYRRSRFRLGEGEQMTDRQENETKYNKISVSEDNRIYSRTAQTNRSYYRKNLQYRYTLSLLSNWRTKNIDWQY